MTGSGVVSSTSVVFASARPQTLRANSTHASCMPKQMPRNGILRLARILDRAQLAFDAARAEARRDQDAVEPSSTPSPSLFDVSRVDAAHVDGGVVGDAGVIHRLVDRDVGVLELDVLADQRDPHAVLAGARCARRSLPTPRAAAAAAQAQAELG